MSELTDEQIRFIAKHRGTMTYREMAKALGLDKETVARYSKRLARGASPVSGPKVNPVLRIAQFFTSIPPSFWRRAAAAAIFLAAFILRIIYIKQLSGTYFFIPFKGGYDDYIFDRWALDILKGQWLGDGIIYIYRMPLYVYFIAGIYYLIGHSYWCVYIVQALLGALSCVFVYHIGRRLFSSAAGFIAGIFSAFYGVFFYYCGMLVGETLCLFFNCLAFLALVKFQYANSLVRIFFAGLLIGLSMLLRGNMLIMFPCIIVWIIWVGKGAGIKRITVRCALFAFGAMLAVLPVMVRNYIAEKDIVPITALSGLNMYIGNAYGADGRYRGVPEISTNPENMVQSSIAIAEKAAGRRLKPSEVSSFWTKKAVQSVIDHGGMYLAGLYWTKFILFCNAYELPDIWNYYFFGRYIPVLTMPLVSFSFIISFGAAGMYLAWRRRRELSILYIVVIGYMVSLLLVFITSRYRMQVVPFISIFAGYAVFEMARTVFSDTRRVVWAVLICLAVFAFSHIPVKRASFETSHNSLAILLKRDGKIDGAINEYKKAIDIAPRYPSPYYNLGILYRDKGDIKTATDYFHRALSLDPSFIDARARLNELEGDVYESIDGDV